MTLDHLAAPLLIEQVGEAFRHVLRLHQVGVVAERGQPHARGDEQPVGIAVGGREMLRHFVGQIRREPAVALEGDEMRGVRAVDDVAGVDVASHLLRDALKDALGARAFDPHRDAGKLRLERLGELLGHRQIHGGVERDLALFPGGLDQRRRDRGRGRRLRAQRTGEDRQAGGGGGFQEIASGNRACRHYPLPISMSLRAKRSNLCHER
jgi:hypothetical protein